MHGNLCCVKKPSPLPVLLHYLAFSRWNRMDHPCLIPTGGASCKSHHAAYMCTPTIFHQFSFRTAGSRESDNQRTQTL